MKIKTMFIQKKNQKIMTEEDKILFILENIMYKKTLLIARFLCYNNYAF